MPDVNSCFYFGADDFFLRQPKICVNFDQAGCLSFSLVLVKCWLYVSFGLCSAKTLCNMLNCLCDALNGLSAISHWSISRINSRPHGDSGSIWYFSMYSMVAFNKCLIIIVDSVIVFLLWLSYNYSTDLAGVNLPTFYKNFYNWTTRPRVPPFRGRPGRHGRWTINSSCRYQLLFICTLGAVRILSVLYIRLLFFVPLSPYCLTQFQHWHPWCDLWVSCSL